MDTQSRRVFSLQDFPPISDTTQVNNHIGNNYGGNNFQGNGIIGSSNNSSLVSNSYQNNHNVIPTYFGGPLMGQPAEQPQSIKGHGILTWLSSKAGLITTADGTVISFQSKEFCDQNLNDLLQVLRVGFTLKYHAILTDGNQYTANQVSPLFGEEATEVFKNSKEVDLEAANPNPPNAKDAYSSALEKTAYHALLSTFQRNGIHKIQLSSLHSQMSNYGDDKLYRYVGSSSMKRRQFVERRTHVFCLQNDDTITLQYPAVYQCVVLLSSFLLRHGGVSSIQCLYDFYASPEIPQNVKDHVGYDRQNFLNLLISQNFAFAVFPSRAYVSARRNLPDFDYCEFIEQNFPMLAAPIPMPYEQQMQQQPQLHQPLFQPHHPRGVQRTMSVPMGDSYGMTGRPFNQSSSVQHRPHHYNNQFTAPMPVSSSYQAPAPVNGSRQTSPHQNDLWRSGSRMGGWLNSVNSVSNAQTRQPSRVGSPSTFDLYNDNQLSSEFGNLLSLRQNSGKISTASQVDDSRLGTEGCTCECTCGRTSVNDTSSTRSANAGVIGSSRALPTILPGVSNLGLLGNRPLSISTSSSDDQPQVADSYDLFVSNDILTGNFGPLRFGNF
ncbi:hypothetical protein GCK72_025453 [Caenorhabditis remanei]|uniref:Lin-66-like winged helix domain-containing protein n=1 Tax=Caenorhabditis remanei TaxID=31234 RepID=A0A6A5G219_CAERE|nr:hypothetical protein GCK72_025453 [Caenorhabditis remanei]KAF1748986.1 hypothetical protein GCK72_025453 [Caenorhabditis remanei]